MKKIVQSRLRFLDEAGATTTLTRLYARARGGARTTEAVPRNYGQSTSMIATLGVDGVEAPMLIEGSVDTLVFNAYCEQILQPTLKPGDIIVLDNLGAHRASRIEETAASCGARVLWLPPYSPDCSPIELMWSKVKAYLKRLKPELRLNWKRQSPRHWKPSRLVIAEIGSDIAVMRLHAIENCYRLQFPG